MSTHSTIKKKLFTVSTLIVVFTMIASLFGTSTSNVSATSTIHATDAVASYDITTNANEAQGNGSAVIFNIDYKSLPETSGKGTNGEQIVVNLPNNMSTVFLLEYDKEQLIYEQRGSQLIFTYNQDVLDNSIASFAGNILITSNTVSLGSSPYSIEVGNAPVLTGNLVVIPKVSQGPILMSAVGKLETSDNNQLKSIIYGEVNTVRYRVAVNNEHNSGMKNQNLNVQLPQGMKFVENTLYISNPQNGANLTSQFPLTTFTENSFALPFSGGDGKSYNVDFDVQIENTQAEEFLLTAVQNYDLGSTKQTDRIVNVSKVVKYKKAKTEKLVYHELLIRKYDKQTNLPLAGAKFSIKSVSKNAEVAQGTTDSNGRLNIKNLVSDTYEIKEISAPKGYILNSEIKTVSITKHNEEVAFFNEKEAPVIEKGKIKVKKQDATTKEALAGAEFSVTDQTGKVVATLVTDQLGNAEVELPVGTYTVKETKAPTNYILNVTPQNVTVTKGTDANVTFLNEKEKGKIKVRKYESKLGYPLAGAEFSVTDQTGKVVATVTTDQFGEAEVDLPVGTYTVKETKAPTGYVLNVTPQTVNVVSNGKENLIFRNDKEVPAIEKGKIKVKKQDATTKEALAGAEFTVTDLTEKVVATMTTDVNGNAEVELPVGVYTVKETKAPTGYVLNVTAQKATVVKEADANLTFLNEKEKGKIKIHKYESECGYPLAGAEFTVTDTATGKVVGTLITDQFGEASIDLPVGTYEVKETKAPAGYILDAKPQTVTVVKNEKADITFTNDKAKPEIGKIKVRKYESKFGYPLAGAEFSVTDQTGKVVATMTTDQFGEAEVELPVGVYTVKETKAPTGYILNVTPQTATVVKGGTSDLIFRNDKAEPEKGKIKIRKYESDCGYPLLGAEFTITDVATGKIIGTFITDQFGEVEIELPVGTYEVKETKAPTGYVLDAKLQTLTVVKDTKVDVKFTNNKEKGKIKVKKQDAETKAVLAGAEFTVTDETGKVVATLTTNANGEAEVELSVGTYTVKETKAPAGYVLDVTAQKVTVIKGTDANVSVLNSREKGKIKVKKQDAETKAVLAGAEFTVTDETGKVVATLTTNANGEAAVDLPVGVYTVKETKAPAGYVLDVTAQKVTVIKGTDANVSVLNNREKGKIRIEKYDDVTYNLLAGAEFTITDVTTGKVVTTATTNKDGVIELELPVGKYEVKETKAPVGYVLDSTPKTVAINVNKTETVALTNHKSEPEKGKIRIEKYDDVTYNLLAGAEFTITDVTTGKIVTTATTNKDGVIELELPVGKYEVKETKAPVGYVLDSTPKTVAINVNKTETVALTNHKSEPEKGKLRIKKQDAATKDVLAGAEFTVTDETGKVVATLTTNASGDAEVDLPVGVYTVKETKAPAGYVLNVTAQKATIVKGSNATLTFLNEKAPVEKGKLKIRKYESECGYPLIGAEFTVTDVITGKVVGTLVTNTFGEASIELPIGKYEVKESKAPVGYILDATPQTATVVKNNTVTLMFMNNKEPEKGKLKIRKYDTVCGYALAGAEFAIIDTKGKVVTTVITNSFGEVEIELPAGQYQVKETKAPTGYVLDSTPKSVAVSLPCTTIVVFYNEKAPTGNGKIKVTKVDACTGGPLIGAEFTVTDGSGKVVATLVTNGFGEAEATLPIGTYSVKETKAPVGYVLDSTPKSASVTRNGYLELRFCNFQSPVGSGKIKVTKVDACTGGPLSGAEFTVTDGSGKVVATLVTNGFGVAEVSLPTGTYSVKETKAPTGYVLDSTPKSVSVTRNGYLELRFCNFQSAPETGKLRIVKYDADCGYVLAGAEFTVVDVATGKKVAVLVTDSNGEAVKDLPIGKYQITETKAPRGYMIDNTPAVVTLVKGKVIKLTSYNQKIQDCTPQWNDCNSYYTYVPNYSTYYYC